MIEMFTNVPEVLAGSIFRVEEEASTRLQGMTTQNITI
jgi:hypothetical protein